MSDHGTSRRDALRSLAGLAAGGAGLSGAAGAGRADEGGTASADGPIHASGTRINTFRPDGDRFRVTSRFVSPDLARYGRRAVEFDSEQVHREAVPQQYRDPDRAFTVRFADTAVVGTFREHAAAERALAGGASDVTTQSTTYTGPLYVYNSSVSDPGVGDLGERTGPINVGWDESLGMTPSEIGTTMHDDGGWSTPWLGTAGDRYVILHFEGTTTLYTKKQDTHVGKDYGSIFTPDQYHVRLYDLPWHTDDNLAVVGQAHLDPNDHGQLGGDVNWSFVESRREVTDTWFDLGRSILITFVDNGSRWESSDGYLGQVGATL